MTGMLDQRVGVRRAVEVMGECGSDAWPQWKVGSGFLVGGRLVVTAGHNLDDAHLFFVRGDGGEEWTAQVVARGEADRGVDLALLEITAAAFGEEVSPVRFARVDREASELLTGCWAVGFPRFKEKPGASYSGVTLRDSVQVSGTIAPGSNRTSGTLELQVTAAPDPSGERGSPWEGMSGGLVFASDPWLGDCAVGVVVEHFLREGGSSLTVAPITMLDHLPKEQADSWWQLLALRDVEKLVVLPRSAAAGEPLYRATIADIAARTPILLDREDELAECVAFATSDDGYRWVIGRPWAGKTALAAHVVQSCPAGVDCVAYFLARREADADSARLMTVIGKQLAWLLGESPPDRLDVPETLRALWHRTVEQVDRQQRHLLLVVDGLDEDLSHDSGQPSIPALLPTQVGGRAHVLVTSRPHPDLPADVPVDHPLRRVEPVELAASPHAEALRDRAVQELAQLFKSRDELAIDCLGLIAAAEGALSLDDLTDLVGRASSQPAPRRLAVKQVLAERIGRVVRPTSLSSVDRYVFAHEELRERSVAEFSATELDRYRSALHAWADRYRADDWSADPPAYLLDTYPGLLAHHAPDRLAALIADPGWLLQAVAALGVDRAVGIIAAARQAATIPRSSPARATPDIVEAVERALRRSRIALARDGAQLPGVLHARLKDEADPTLATLGMRVGQATGRPWLQMVEGSLDWRADIETTYGLVGKVRALGFGEMDGRPEVAIAIDNRVVLWDPRHGVPDEAAVLDLGDHKATAVAVAAIDDRPVVVTSAAYEGATEVWDPRSGACLAAADVGLGHTLAVGRLGDRLVIAGAHGPNGPDGAIGFLDATTLEFIEPGERLRDQNVVAFAAREGRLVALTQLFSFEDGTTRIQAVDATDGAVLWHSVALDVDVGFDAVAGGDMASTFVVVAASEARTFWLTEDNLHIEESAHGNEPVRALAVGSVNGHSVVAWAPDYDDTALVVLHQVEHEATADGVTLFRPRVDGGASSLCSVFDEVPTVFESSPPQNWDEPPASFAVDRPEVWPHTAVARGVLDGRPVVVTGSVEGSAWVWDINGDPPRPLAGPFATISPIVLERGWEALMVKPSASTADSVALGHHPDHGPIVAVACDGTVRLYSVLTGEPVDCPTTGASVIAAVDLGRVNERDTLVTGSKGGVLGVWALAPPQRLAVVTLDDPIVDVRIVTADPAGHIAARTGTGRVFVVELVEP